VPSEEARRAREAAERAAEEAARRVAEEAADKVADAVAAVGRLRGHQRADSFVDLVRRALEDRRSTSGGGDAR
jgi:hypothetical protein